MSLEISAMSTPDDLSDMHLPQNLEKLILRDLSHLKTLQGLTFPAGLQQLTLYALAQVSDLSAIEFPASLKELHMNRMYGIKELQNVRFPPGLEKLSLYKLKNLQGLEGVIFPGSLLELDLTSNTQIVDFSGVVFPPGLQKLIFVNMGSTRRSSLNFTGDCETMTIITSPGSEMNACDWLKEPHETGQLPEIEPDTGD